MKNLLEQIEGSLTSRYYFLSLMSSLTIPDIAGALDSEDGMASGERYATWYEEYVRPQFARAVLASLPPHIPRNAGITTPNPLTGESCYQFRCSLLHQGSTQHPKSPFSKIIFIEPGATTNIVHYARLSDALGIDVPTFCKEMVAGAREWLEKVENTERYLHHYERFASRHPDGLSPYIAGVPVIA